MLNLQTGISYHRALELNVYFLRFISSTKKLVAVVTCLFLWGIGLTRNDVVSAQNYQDGYVITVSGDTLEGLIDSKGWIRNPRVISFKQTSSESPVNFSPSTAVEFGVSGDRYVSRHVQIDQNPDYLNSQLQQLTPDRRWRDKAPISDTVFLFVEVRGKLSLYHFYDFKHHFFIESAGRTEELARVERLFVDEVTQTWIKKYVSYRKQLSGAISSCPNMDGATKRLKFKRKELIKTVIQYNECVAPDTPLYVNRQKQTAHEWGIHAGVTRTTVDMISRLAFNTLNLNEIQLDPSYTFDIGLSHSIRHMSNQGRWAWVNEISWNTYSFQSKVDWDTNPEGYYVTFDNHYARWSSLVRVYRSNRGVQPFVQLGLTGARLFRFQSEFRKRPVNGNDQHEGAFINKPRRWEAGLTGGFGARYQQFSLEARTSFTTGFTPGEKIVPHNIDTYVTYVNLLIGYHF